MGINRGVNPFFKRPLIIIKVGNAMKTDKYATTALAILLDAVVGINPKQIMMVGSNKEAREDMTVCPYALISIILRRSEVKE